MPTRPTRAAAPERDEDFPAEGLPTSRQHFDVHDDAVGTVAEARWYGCLFLRQLADDEPAMAEELRAAADCFEAEHDIMWGIWALAGGLGRSDEHAKKLAQPFTRERMRPLIRLSREKDEQGAEHIEKALNEE